MSATFSTEPLRFRGRESLLRGSLTGPLTGAEKVRTVEDMTDTTDPQNVGDNPRSEIREFLSTRRARVTPGQAGLPEYGAERRRVKGLRREEVALLAGISSEYYTRLERGNATGVSDSVIDGIAQALQLDDVERTHLVRLLRTAGTTRAPRRRQPSQQKVRSTVQRVLDAMTTSPAF